MMLESRSKHCQREDYWQWQCCKLLDVLHYRGERHGMVLQMQEEKSEIDARTAVRCAAMSA